MEKTLPHFGVSFAKPFILKIEYSKPSKIIEILELLHFYMYQYYTHNSRKLYISVYVYGSYHVSFSEVPWNVYDISDTYNRRDIKTPHIAKGIWRKLLQLLRWLLQNPSYSKYSIQNLPKSLKLWTLHISVFVNMTSIIVNSYTALFMCMEVIICQSERSPEILIISQTPMMGGHQNTSDGSRNMEEILDIPNLPKLWKFGPSTCIYLCVWNL